MPFVVRDLEAGPARRALVRGLGFAIERGERVALVGPSGAGKTTVLRALCLLDDPLAGTLTLDDRTPEEIGYARWRRRVALLPQRAAFFGGTVEEELSRPFTYAAADAPFDLERARAWLDRLGLPGVWERPVSELSEGERQRVAFVRTLAIAPAVLLLDEPTSALDPAATEAVEALIREADAAAVIVTHDAAQRARLAARPIDLVALHPEAADRAR